MARKPKSDPIERMLDREAPEGEQSDQPTYKLMGDAKIPVSKHLGKLWQGRRDSAVKNSESGMSDRFDEAIRYYENLQADHRHSGREGRSGNTASRNGFSEEWSETENLVFANTTTLLPAVYAKNPSVEVTALTEDKDRSATLYERVINAVMQLKSSPGVNLKPKTRRGVLATLLCNIGWIEIGWTFKDASSEEAIRQINDIGEQMAKAKSQKEIKELEGKLIAIEKHIDALSPEGPWAKHRSPRQVYIDPMTQESDLSDCGWLMYFDFLHVDYVNARFNVKDNSGKYTTQYDPTHVISAGSQTVEDEVNNFSLFTGAGNYSDFGYKNEEALRDASRIKVWYVWDKATRRLYLFHDKQWAWPIWVWNDPYSLDRFFPLYPLIFVDSVEGFIGPSEVNNYLDQQDAINEMNSEQRLARGWAKRNVFFDRKRIKHEDVMDVLNGPDGTARGVDVPDGMTLQDVIYSFVPPSVKFPELFDKADKYQAIDRLTSVTQVMRNSEFKTNTTNEAISTYQASTQTRLDEKIDLIEDWIGDIAYGLLQMCVQWLSPEMVQSLIGVQAASEGTWASMHPAEFRKQYKCKVVGGSSVKPTSQAKKKEAIQIGQILGQFADAAPEIVVVAVKVMERAFDEVVIKEEDWTAIRRSMEMQLNAAGAGPQGAGAGGPPTGAPNGAGGPDPKALVQALVAKGIPPEVAERVVAEKLGNGAGAGAPQAPQGETIQ